jgi:hypothetical protein
LRQRDSRERVLSEAAASELDAFGTHPSDLEAALG